MVTSPSRIFLIWTGGFLLCSWFSLNLIGEDREPPPATMEMRLGSWDAPSTTMFKESWDAEASTFCLFQDRAGYVWTGCRNGLSRYDGKAVRRYPLGPPNSALASYFWVKDIAQSPQDTGIWAVTKSKLVYIAPLTHKIESIELPKPSLQLSQIETTPDGRIWVGGSKGVYLFDSKTRSVEIESLAPDSFEVAEIQKDRKEPFVLWITGRKGALLRFDTQAGKWQTFAAESGFPVDERSLGFLQKEDGTVLVGFEGKVIHFDPKTETSEEYQFPLKIAKSNVLRMATDPQSGMVWAAVSGFNSPVRLDLEKGEVTAFDKSFTNSKNAVVQDVLFDDTGLLWTSYVSHGVYHADLHAPRATVFRHSAEKENTIPGEGIIALDEGVDGLLWVATSRGVASINIETTAVAREMGNFPSIDENVIIDMCLGPDDLPWLHTSGGVYQLRKSAVNTLSWERVPGIPKRSTNRRGMLAFEGKDTLWVASGDRIEEYLLAEGKVNRHFTIPEGINVMKMFDGDLWVGTYNNLYQLNTSTGELRTTNEENVNICDLAQLSDGDIWVAARDGLFPILDGKLQKNNPVYRGYVTFVEPAIDSQYLWFSGNEGLCFLNVLEKRYKLASPYLSEQHLNVRPERGIALRESRRLVFGNWGSLASVEEKSTLQPRLVPPGNTEFAIMSYYSGSGKDLPGTNRHNVRSLHLSERDSISLHYADRGISIYSRMLDFRLPERQRFSFRLNGENWSTWEYKNHFSVPHLPPGTHTLEMRALSSQEVHSEKPARLKLVVTAPFWAATWFRVLVLTFVLAAIGLFFRRRYLLLKGHDREMRKSEKRYRKLVESANDAIILVAADTSKILTANPAAAELLAIENEAELLGLSFTEFDPLEGNSAEREFWEKIQKGEAGFSAIVELKDRAGNIRAAHGSATLLDTGSDQEPAICLQLADMTEKLELEQRIQHSEKMKAIGTLAGGIAHDFNNLLTPIILHNQMALEDIYSDNPDTESIADGLSLSLEAATKAAGLVDQILTFSRSTVEQSKQAIVVQDTLQQTIKLLRGTVTSNVEIQLDSKLKEECVLASSSRLHQIIMNLGINASHAIGKSAGVIKVEAEVVSHRVLHRSGEFIRLTVSDTGCGMSPEIQKRVFEPFFTTRETGKGTGLGLAMVHGAIDELGGSIEVESEETVGTTFICYLPITKPDQDKKKSDEKRSSSGLSDICEAGSAAAPWEIVIVDDEPLVLLANRKILERLGYRVTAFGDSVTARDYLLNDEKPLPDLVITDQMMPNLTGIELSDAVHQKHPELPLMLLTGYTESLMDQDELARVGLLAVHMKPVEFKALRANIEAVLQDRERACDSDAA